MKNNNTKKGTKERQNSKNIKDKINSPFASRQKIRRITNMKKTKINAKTG